jgi:pimeloyl-ACP methyl ester carboxylesterase
MIKKLAIVLVYLVIILAANRNTLVFAQNIKTASENTHIPSNYMTSSAITHHFALVNGIRLHYVIAGHGKPVVLLHGWPETWYEWRHIIPSLAKNYTVIAPDLPGLGDSSKPVSGYDGKTVADDIYKLVTQLGFKQIFLVGHDWGGQVAYSYAAAHPSDVRRLVIIETPLPGIASSSDVGKFYPPSGGGLWWISFHIVPNLPEKLVAGKERLYLSWFYDHAYNKTAINGADVTEYVKHYSAPGGMHAGFEYYRAIFDDISQNKEYAKTKLTMPVLALGGDHSFGNLIINSVRNPVETV